MKIKFLIFKYFNLPILIISFLFVVGLQCKKPTPPDNYVPSIHLELEELGVTEAWLKIKMEDTKQAVDFILKRNDQIVNYGYNFPHDTIIIDNYLLPKQTYIYRAYKLIDNKIIDSSSALVVTTMDTTSHEFIWEIDTLGGIQSRINGLWASDENNVYAVGKFQLDTNAHIARWDGSKWTYLRPYAVNGWGGIQAGELLSIFGISRNKVWAVGYGYGSINGISPDTTWGFIAEWNGSQWKNISPSAPGEYFISIWASSEKDIWITTAHGYVYHYNGLSWEKLSKGTNYYLSDIWGFSNNDIFFTGYLSDQACGSVFHYNGTNVIQEFTSFVSFRSIWGAGKKTLYAASYGGLFTNKSGIWVEIIYPGFRAALEKVRASAKNDLFVCGHFGKLLHYNGYTWKNYETQFGGSDIWILKAINVLKNTVFIGGIGGEGFDRRGIVLKGRR